MSRAAALDKTALEKGLPCDLAAERFVLGSVLLNGERLSEVAGTVTADDFSLESHRRIYGRILQLAEIGKKIDHFTVASELQRFGELESVGGLTALVDLDTGLPHIAHLDAYVALIRDKSALRRIILASQHLMNRALMAEESPDDILAGAEELLLGIGEDRQAGDEGLMSAGDFLRKFPGGFQNFIDPAKREKGFSTGFIKLDEMTGGLRAGELIILAARPGVGKSGLALNIAWNVATRSLAPVGIFSLEMSRESLLLRMLCSAARVDSQRLRTGYLNPSEREKIRAAANRLVDAPIYIDDTSNLGLMELHAKIRRFEHQTKQRLGLVIVDYLQLMASKGKAENENRELGRLTRGMKLMSKELGCPFLVLSQLSRGTEARTGDKRPQLQDLRGSGSIEQDSDIVAFIYRPEMHSSDREDLRGLAELLISKNRSGPIGKVDLIFLHAQVRFENQADDLGEIPPDGERLPYAD